MSGVMRFKVGRKGAEYVLASDYDQLHAANQRLEGEVKRLASMTVNQHNRIVAALTAPPSPDAELVELLSQCRGIVAKEVERWTRAAAILPVNADIESSLLTRIDAKLASLKGEP